ncbi:hypothetical protein DH2020_015568 [Rehmannia glutinosa]|uniref:NmrA-like domain-containing protein n=1 Tax=Rehmannia glutinosa TaxID=99300 RepID=A0ABR0WTL9_REHGL
MCMETTVPPPTATTVCVTGAAGFIGSWLVMRLLQRGYNVRATVRDPGDMKKVKHLIELPKANTNLTLWKADMNIQGSYDEAIQGCEGVFHMATPMDFESHDPEMYFVSKILAEKAAMEAAKENNIDFISIIPPVVVGPFIMPTFPPSLITALSPITGNEAHYSIIKQGQFVHVDDLCEAHILLFEHPAAEGRYICSSHDATIYDIANMIREKWPEYHIPTEFEGIDKDIPVVCFSSKKLMGMGFSFKYTLEDMYRAAIETCREKGLLPYSTQVHTSGEEKEYLLDSVEKDSDGQEKELLPNSKEKHAEGQGNGLLSSDPYSTQIHTNGEEKELLLNSLEKHLDGQEKAPLPTSKEKKAEGHDNGMLLDDAKFQTVGGN